MQFYGGKKSVDLPFKKIEAMAAGVSDFRGDAAQLGAGQGLLRRAGRWDVVTALLESHGDFSRKMSISRGLAKWRFSRVFIRNFGESANMVVSWELFYAYPSL
jgi:hypothetical protein